MYGTISYLQIMYPQSRLMLIDAGTTAAAESGLTTRLAIHYRRKRYGCFNSFQVKSLIDQ